MISDYLGQNLSFDFSIPKFTSLANLSTLLPKDIKITQNIFKKYSFELVLRDFMGSEQPCKKSSRCNFEGFSSERGPLHIVEDVAIAQKGE